MRERKKSIRSSVGKDWSVGAYKLELLITSTVHPVFHVGSLKRATPSSVTIVNSSSVDRRLEVVSSATTLA